MEAHDCNWRDSIGCINERCPLHRAMRMLGKNLWLGGGLAAAAQRGPLPQHPSANEPHEFSEAFNAIDCTICGEGFCYYLHTDRPEYEP